MIAAVVVFLELPALMSDTTGAIAALIFESFLSLRRAVRHHRPSDCQIVLTDETF